jgi:hypothetical protein
MCAHRAQVLLATCNVRPITWSLASTPFSLAADNVLKINVSEQDSHSAIALLLLCLLALHGRARLQFVLPCLVQEIMPAPCRVHPFAGLVCHRLAGGWPLPRAPLH